MGRKRLRRGKEDEYWGGMGEQKIDHMIRRIGRGEMRGWEEEEWKSIGRGEGEEESRR